MGCSDKGLTGGAVGDVSTITIQAQYENGSLFPGASIYVNENFKGTTREYGADVGTRTVVLSENDNTVRVEATGYTPYFIKSISGASKGEQHLTAVLQERRTMYTVFIEDQQGAVQEAAVDLYQKDALLRTGISDSQGKVFFGKLENGDYTLKVTALGHESREVPVTVKYNSNTGRASTVITLLNQPQVDVQVLSGEIKLPEAEIMAYSIEGYNQPNPVPISTVYTDSEGEATIVGIEYGVEYVLIVRREGFNAVTMRRMFTADDHALEVSMSVEI